MKPGGGCIVVVGVVVWVTVGPVKAVTVFVTVTVLTTVTEI